MPIQNTCLSQPNFITNSNCRSFFAKTFLISACALAIIGLLAACEISVFRGMAPYYEFFLLGSATCFIFLCVQCCCCCSSVSKKQSVGPAKTINTEKDKTPKVKPPQPKPIQPLTAEELFLKGRTCVQGEGSTRDYVQALRYYEEAASQGHVLGNYYAAKCYDKGLGADKNVDEARYLYKCAARRGHIKASFLFIQWTLAIAVETEQQGKLTQKTVNDLLRSLSLASKNLESIDPIASGAFLSYYNNHQGKPLNAFNHARLNLLQCAVSMTIEGAKTMEKTRQVVALTEGPKRI